MSVTPGSTEPVAQGAVPLLLIEEITHRVINEYAVAIRSIDSEAAHLVDVAARAALGRATARLRAQADAHRALQPPAARGSLNLGEYLARLCAALSAACLAEHGMRLELVDEDIDLAPERCWRVGLIVSELFANAIRHDRNTSGRTITVQVRRGDAEVRCRVADNGVASSDPGASRGRGVVVRLAHELGGDVNWCFMPDGVTALLSFPAFDPLGPTCAGQDEARGP
jgi:two-component sensor histidine kinase